MGSRNGSRKPWANRVHVQVLGRPELGVEAYALARADSEPPKVNFSRPLAKQFAPVDQR